MIKFEKINPGMLLWDCRKTKSFFTGRGREWSTWPVKVLDIDIVNRKAFVSWNHNAPKWISERSVTKYRKNRPERK